MTSINVKDYQPWPRSGDSFDVGATAVCLAVTNLAALAARLYTSMRQRRELRFAVTTILVGVAHVLMVVQSGLVIASCYYGWGSEILRLPENNIHKAERLFFASNLFTVLVHGFSRASVGCTLVRASEATSTSKVAVGILSVVPLWVIGSMLGVTLNRLSGPTFWLPIGQDCNFVLWTAIYVVGLGIDIVVAACGVKITANLQMALAKKIFTMFVFSFGIFGIVPMAYGLSYLHKHSSEILRDPTLYSSSFIHANQAAIAVSLWCRALEAARMLQQDMGYAPYGHGSESKLGSYVNSKAKGYYGVGSMQSKSRSLPRKKSQAEDEIELRPADRSTRHIANVEGGTTTSISKQDQSWSGGIAVSREYGFVEHDLESDT